MDDNENKKNNETMKNDGGVTDEALPDEALEGVAGGGFRDWLEGIFDPAGVESSDSPPTGQGDHL